MSRIIIVSNRLPVKVQKKDTGLQYKLSEGGLATGLSSVAGKEGNLWVGWPGLFVDLENEKQQVITDLQSRNMQPVFLSEEDITDFYEGFSNETLWPNFHYFSQFVSINPSHWQAYEKVNQKFLQAVLRVAKPGDTIWVHDYQLMLLPGLLRKELPDCNIGYFHHVPFPAFEVFRQLPWHKQLTKGLLGADLVGFHTAEYMQHFFTAARQINGCSHEGSRIRTKSRSLLSGVFPTGIDYGKYAEMAASKEANRRGQLYRKALKDQKVILSIDRLDYTKGIVERLQAFEYFLDQYPEYLEKVTLVMLVVPSRDKVKQYKKLKEQVDELVGRINAKFGSILWVPVQYFYQSLPTETLAALYRLADIALVTPLRDGMNLVAKEFVACRTDASGVLILSELAGAAQELTEAIQINPHNKQQVASALLQALNMPLQEQNSRIRKMQQYLQENTVHNWVASFMAKLQQSKKQQKMLQTTHVSSTVQKNVQLHYQRAKSRLILVDADGLETQLSVLEKPGLDPELTGLIAGLSRQTENMLVIFSGTNRFALEKKFTGLPVDLVAEHGAWIKRNGKEWRMVHQPDNSWKKELLPVFTLFRNRLPESEIEENDFSLIYRCTTTTPEQASILSLLHSQLSFLTGNQQLQVIKSGNEVIVKNVEVTKGRAARNWLAHLEHYFILAIGSHQTSETLFKAMPVTAITMQVGDPVSEANYYLSDTEELKKMLKLLPRIPSLPPLQVSQSLLFGQVSS